jgi:hypothetical protein
MLEVVIISDLQFLKTSNNNGLFPFRHIPISPGKFPFRISPFPISPYSRFAIFPFRPIADNISPIGQLASGHLEHSTATVTSTVGLHSLGMSQVMAVNVTLDGSRCNK